MISVPSIPSIRLLIGLALCLLSLGVLAEAPAPIRVGVLYWSMQIPGQVAMRQGLEAEAARINRRAASQGLPQVELLAKVAGDGPEGIERQIAQMKTLVAQQPDIIIVQPTDNAALAEPLLAANAVGIPVVAYDQYISGGRLAAYVTSDNRQAGYLDGEYIADHFTDQRPIRLVLVEYPHVSSTVERLNGFLDALDDQGQPYRILKAYKAVQPEEGRRVGEAMLRDFPEPGSIDVVFAVNDGGGLAVVEALEAAGRDEIVVASIDGDPKSVRRIANGGLIHIDSAQFCGPLGAEAMKTAYAIATQRPHARHLLVPVFPVTRHTLDRYPGWLGPIPGPFDKPWKAENPTWDGQLRALQ
ncbi:sugar ABC transporter substrate-binding protein [Magnetovirga frankeli]|uniref:sugar ABC transporter substrate-binding protein n=1 Tax=Magnetovirga frankeli TaxID=947516 RepID=UPI003D336020